MVKKSLHRAVGWFSPSRMNLRLEEVFMRVTKGETQ